MSDLAMCQDKECPMRHSCYRFTAKPAENWQSFPDFQRPPAAEKCDSYIYDDD